VRRDPRRSGDAAGYEESGDRRRAAGEPIVVLLDPAVCVRPRSFHAPGPDGRDNWGKSFLESGVSSTESDSKKSVKRNGGGGRAPNAGPKIPAISGSLILTGAEGGASALATVVA
jgi:hypothetical protein